MAFRSAIVYCFLLLAHFVWSQPVAMKGLMDARSFNFSSQRLSLTGQWLWTDNKLLTPGKWQGGDVVDFPKPWNKYHNPESGQGYATYSLTVLVPATIKQFAIELPQIYSSYRLWVNQTLVASNGTPGKSEAETIPQWMPQTCPFNIAGDTIRLTLQIANFHHNKGGCKEPIYLGESATMKSKRVLSTTSKLIECSVLLVLSIVFIILYFQRGKRKAVFYFALLCLTWSIRSVFSNEYTFISFFPDFNWTLMIKIEYLTLYLTMIWAILVLSHLFASESNPIIKYSLVVLNSLFIVYTVFAPPVQFTIFLQVYLATSGILLAYCSLVVIRAFTNERIGSNFLTVSVLLALLLFAYDVFAYEGMFAYNSIVFSAGYVTIFLLLGIALLYHLGIFKRSSSSSTMLTFKDLYGDGKK